jgi:hypothetical protein
MREYFAHKLRSSLTPWREAIVIDPDRIQIRYGYYFLGIDFVVTFGKRAVVIIIIDGIYKAPDLNVVYGQDTAFDLRNKLLEVEKMEACDVIMAGRHALKAKEGVTNMTGIYSHEGCFEKVFAHMKVFLGLPAVVEEVGIRCCGLRSRRLNKIAPFPTEKYEPFSVTHAKILSILNGKKQPTVYASNNLGISDRSQPYGTLGH